MRTRFSWVILLVLIALLNFGCNVFDSGDDNGDDGPWSEPFLTRVTIGNVPVQADETANIPLDNSYSMRFELSKPVSPSSLSILFDFEIFVDNMNTGMSYLLTPSVMEANGELVWVGDSNKIIEYRSNQRLSEIFSGFNSSVIGSPGDKLNVRVIFLVARSDDGNQLALLDDQFEIVWTS